MIKTTLLTAGNQKIEKGEKLGYITKGIHFAPANLAQQVASTQRVVDK
jgi:hypothetical protein